MRREAMIRAADAEISMLRRPEKVPIKMDPCPRCGGTGIDNSQRQRRRGSSVIRFQKPRCHRCRGEGEVPRILGGH